MEAVQRRQILAKDGEVLVTGLPYRKGDAVEVIVLPQPAASERLTVGDLRRSGQIGRSQYRDAIGAGSTFARPLRAQGAALGDPPHDPAR